MTGQDQSPAAQLSEALSTAAAAVEETMVALLTPSDSAAPRLWQAMRYAALSGGKRLRPFFVLQSARLCGVSGEPALRTAAAVDDALTKTEGTVMVVVNSVCGCAAGKARPGVALALKHAAKPDLVATVFAGADIEATERARSYFTGYPPSSPSIALFRNGRLVYMMERHQIENQEADAIATQLTTAFDTHCASEPVAG